MLKFKMLFLCLVCSIYVLLAQDSLNMEQLYNYDDNSLPITSNGVIFNDCWGYTDEAGNEYAIMGSSNRIFFFDITDPANTRLIREFVNGDPDIDGNLTLGLTAWRDFKTYGDKAYACSERAGEGLIVFDLSELPDTVTVEEQIDDFFTRSHNIFIDTAVGYLYTAGARLGNTRKDVIILDLNTDPIELVADVSIDGGYIHDIHVVNDTAYCNSESSELYIIDFSDPENPVTIGSLDNYTGSGYNHSGWRTDDGNYYVFCDETVGRKVKIMDVSDPENISNADITDQFFSNLLDEDAVNPSSLAHNPFIIGDLVYLSYYDDGVQIFNISDPFNVVREAYYDTNDNTSYVHDGVWGVYPYFESGTIIASDILNGLFVLRRTDAPLPVELVAFEAKAEGAKVRLDWSTATEKNSAAFEVERSADGINFSTLQSVPANTNSAIQIDYQAYDEAPLFGDNYYRLKQIDLDGKFQYSEVQTVQFVADQVKITPTFINTNIAATIHVGEETTDLKIEVISVNGQLLQSHYFQVSGVTTLELPIDELQNGLYFFRIQADQSWITEKVMIAR